MPSLLQLDEAVRAYREEHPDDEMIVVVDATFAHRIPEDERPMFEEAAAHNELVYPPAGAIGRGDAFLLRIAEKTGAVVLSNDSFQEFHGEHDWLFDKGRLIGGTPVPGVGWIFVARTPVRGPKSREAVKEAKRTRARIGSKDASQPMPVPKAPPPGPGRKKGGKKSAAAGPGGAAGGAAADAIAAATEEAVNVGAPDDGDSGDEGGKKKRKRRKRRSGRGAGGGGGGDVQLPTLNEPLTFIEFIAEHKLGTTVTAEVESFASHGAFVLVGDARCYVPLSSMGDPPPRSAREVLTKGESREFVVQALDAARRGIELSLPGFVKVAGAPTEETVEAEIAEAPEPVHHGPAKKASGPKKKRAAKKAAASAEAAVDGAAQPEQAELPLGPAGDGERGQPAAAKKAGAKKTTAKKAAVKKAAEPVKKAAEPAKKATAKKAIAKKAAEPATKAAATKAPVKKATVKKATAKKAIAKKAAEPATKVTAKKAAEPAKKATAKKATAKKAAAPAKKAAAIRKAAVKKAAAPAKKAAKKS